MTSLYDMYDTSAEAEVSGAWVEIGPAKFLLARTGGANENFMKTAAKRLKPFQNALESMPKKSQDELAIGIFVDTVLLGWSDVKSRAGDELEFSKDNAKALLLDLPNLFGALQVEASRMSNFTQANLEAARKN
jgi:hypothetical protein